MADLISEIVDHTYQPRNESPIMRVTASIDVSSPSRERFSNEAIDNFIRYVLSLQIESLDKFQNTILGRYIDDLRGNAFLTESSVQHSLLTKAIVDILVNFQIHFSDKEGILNLVVALFSSDIFVNNTLYIDLITNVFKVNISSVYKFLLQNYNIPFFTFMLTKLRTFFSSLHGREEEVFNMYFKPFTLNVLNIIFFDSWKKESVVTDSTELKLLLAFVYFVLQKNKEGMPFDIDFFNRAVNFSEKDLDNIAFKYATIGGHWSLRILNVLVTVIQSIASSFGVKVPTFFLSLGKKEFTNEFIQFSSSRKKEGEEADIIKTMSEEQKTQLKILLRTFLEMCKPGKNSILYQAVEQGNEIARTLILMLLTHPVSPEQEGSKRISRGKKKTNATRRKRKIKGGSSVMDFVTRPFTKKSSPPPMPTPPVSIDWKAEIMKIQKNININIDISVFSRYLETVARRVKPTNSQKVQIELSVKMSSVKQWLQYDNSLMKLKIAEIEKEVLELFVLRQDDSFKLFYKLSKSPSLQVQVFKYSFFLKETKPTSNVRIKFSNSNSHELHWNKLFG